MGRIGLLISRSQLLQESKNRNLRGVRKERRVVSRNLNIPAGVSCRGLESVVSLVELCQSS